MSRSHVMLLALGLSAVGLSVSLPAIAPTPAASTELTGTVKDADGKPMEGVAVSAKAQGATITTSVWTNQNGAYAFPTLDTGRYRVWAQAVGFDRPVADAAVATGKPMQQDFTLKPLQTFINRQLSTAEWIESLPAETSQDRRMKMVILNNCSNCHLPATFLEKHFDEASWNIVFDNMEKIAPDGDSPEDSAGDPPGIRAGGVKYEGNELDANGQPAGAHTKLMRFYRKDIIAYLTQIAGPQPFALKPKPFPRPTGVATELVVTEYDLPLSRGGALDKLDPKTGRVSRFVIRDGRTLVEDVPPTEVNEYRSGSDWTLGTRDEHEERGTHDLAVGTDGSIYYGNNAMSSDARGFIWWGARTFYSLDIKNQTIKSYGRTPTMSHGTDTDSKGFVWGSTGYGTVRMDIATGEISEFRSLTPYSRPYDLGIDGMDNVWFSQIAIDQMGVVDGRTGEVKEVKLPPLNSPDLKPEDIKVFNEIGSWDHNSALGQIGPRRMGADKNGNFVYAGLYWAGTIAQLDGRAKSLVAIREVPNGRWAQPYKMIADKNHTLWFSNSAADMLGKFNPTTNQFVVYPLPTRGTNSRHLGVDNTTDPPTVWVPYTGAGKVARVQFRTDTSK